MKSAVLLALTCINEELQPIEKLLIDGKTAEALAKLQEVMGVIRYQIDQEQQTEVLQGVNR